jgi:hypothetical protein|uniref:Uncharacterized protein n=1 Tax=viral metagenome TaxID=1070528 RepID=A0A6C0J230_9ZZZZ
MNNSIKSKKFYSTGFIPLSNDQTRQSQGLRSQLISNSCVNELVDSSLGLVATKPNEESLNNIMYPSKAVKLTYDLPKIPKNSTCLRYLREI